MRVSELYQFDNPESLPFVDVNVLKDSRLFVDPRAIRLDPSPTQYVTAVSYTHLRAHET